MEKDITPGEAMITEMAFNALSGNLELELDFGDDGNIIFVKDREDGKEYELRVKEI